MSPLHIQETKHREVRYFAQGCRANKGQNEDSNSDYLAPESALPHSAVSPPFPDDRPFSLFPVCHEELYASPLCKEQAALCPCSVLGDKVSVLSPGHEGCTLRLLLAEATAQPRTSPVSSCSRGFATDLLTLWPRWSHAATRGMVGVSWCLKAEPRGSDVCAEGTATQEQVETDSRPPGVVLSTRKRLFPSRSAKVQGEAGPSHGSPESQCSISSVA